MEEKRKQDGLENRLARVMQERGWTVATAESCTAGGLAHRITRVAGASDYFPGGVVAYSNRIKTQLLGVSEELLAAHGAVSRQTAEAMALGAASRIGADIGVGITGIAGPGGGSPDKPVGLVYIAVGSPETVSCKRFVFAGDRAAVREQAITEALRMLDEWTRGRGGSESRP